VSLTLGTHNLHDETGHPTPFADVILFTEAIHSEVRDELATTHDVYVCWQQRDLIIAVSKRLEQGRVKRHYRLVHPGVAKVTPHRGTFWLTLRLNGQPCAIVVEHRINAAFPPFKRGEPWFRRAMWRRHTRVTLRIIARHRRKFRHVLCGGDVNTPRGVKGYPGLHEVGDHYDRLASTRPLRDLVVMSRMGSDHPRLRARVS
jgi:hypothetical protein